jgi:UPF0716 family protein affecting phage T7 exclusion
VSQTESQEPTSRRAPHRPTARTVLMVIFGVVLLLPGICSLAFAIPLFAVNPRTMIEEIGGGGTVMAPVALFWAACILISCLGIWLLRHAWRARRS